MHHVKLMNTILTPPSLYFSHDGTKGEFQRRYYPEILLWDVIIRVIIIWTQKAVHWKQKIKKFLQEQFFPLKNLYFFLLCNVFHLKLCNLEDFLINVIKHLVEIFHFFNLLEKLSEAKYAVKCNWCEKSEWYFFF